jgi:tetratricopeptide (TPR) repeat protein
LVHSRADWPVAIARWTSVQLAFPDHPFAFLRGAQALRAAGRLNEAEAVLAAAVPRFADDESLAMARAWLANARSDWPLALECWAQLRQRYPDNPSVLVGTARALQAAGRAAEAGPLLEVAETLLPAACARGFDRVAAQKLSLDIARLRQDWSGLRARAEELLAEESAPRAEAWLALAQAEWHSGDRDAADVAAIRALDIDPKLSEAVLVRIWVAADRGDGPTTIDLYRRLAELNPTTVRWSLKLVQLLNWFGRINEAVAELERLRRLWPDHPSVLAYLRSYGPTGEMRSGVLAGAAQPDNAPVPEEAELRSIAAKAPQQAAWRRPILIDDPRQDVQLVNVAGAETALLVFSNDTDTLSIPLALFDRFMAPWPVSVVYLKDFDRLRYLRGIRSLAGNYVGAREALRQIIAGLGARRVLALGACNGGSAAIRYGIELGAERIVCFAAATRLTPEAPTRLRQKQNFMRHRLSEAVPEGLPDLRPFLQARGRHARVDYFYYANDPREAADADHIADLPGIQLHPHPGDPAMPLLRRLAVEEADFSRTLAVWLDQV